MPDIPINRSGAPTNTPQHILDNGTGITEGTPSGDTAREGAHRQTGANTAPPERDVTDPHPSDEEHPYREKEPGGANPPSDTPRGHVDNGPNPAVHTGTAPPRPHNAGSGPD